MLFILKKLLVILFILVCGNAISQNYMGYKIKDVTMIKGNNFTETKSTSNSGSIMYKTPNTKLYSGGETIESFGYNGDGFVIRYFRFDTVDEDEVMKIVRTNNQDYKRVDVGSKQNYFQWIDPKNSYNFTLNVIPMEKLFVISYEITKE